MRALLHPLAAVLLAIAAGSALAAPPSEPTPTPRPAVESSTPPAAIVPAPTSPMRIEMRAVLERERGQLDTLSVRLRTATSVREALACQLEIERVKRATEIALLRIQADAARRAGRTALAGQLEASIREIESPPVRGVPVSRPAPAARSADRSATR